MHYIYRGVAEESKVLDEDKILKTLPIFWTGNRAHPLCRGEDTSGLGSWELERLGRWGWGTSVGHLAITCFIQQPFATTCVILIAAGLFPFTIKCAGASSGAPAAYVTTVCCIPQSATLHC